MFGEDAEKVEVEWKQIVEILKNLSEQENGNDEELLGKIKQASELVPIKPGYNIFHQMLVTMKIAKMKEAGRFDLIRFDPGKNSFCVFEIVPAMLERNHFPVIVEEKIKNHDIAFCVEFEADKKEVYYVLLIFDENGPVVVAEFVNENGEWVERQAEEQ